MHESLKAQFEEAFNAEYSKAAPAAGGKSAVRVKVTLDEFIKGVMQVTRKIDELAKAVQEELADGHLQDHQDRPEAQLPAQWRHPRSPLRDQAARKRHSQGSPGG